MPLVRGVVCTICREISDWKWLSWEWKSPFNDSFTAGQITCLYLVCESISRKCLAKHSPTGHSLLGNQDFRWGRNWFFSSGRGLEMVFKSDGEGEIERKFKVLLSPSRSSIMWGIPELGGE